ncbi:MAG: cytochrome P450 [Marmoricola sp.]|nr:cytochrome P450 [Marmoricola sp.]
MPATVLGRPALVVRGEAGARLFYNRDLTAREGVVPAPLAGLLFGTGALHGLDGEPHLQRKEMFLEALDSRRVRAFGDLVAARLHDEVATWGSRAPFPVFDELGRVYGSAVMEWTGIRQSPGEAARRSRQMAEIVDGFGFRPGAYARGWAARLRANRWAAQLVRDARRRPSEIPTGSMLDVLSRGPGLEVPAEVAGVELLNVVRPTVAVAWFGTFAVQALAEHPSYGIRLTGSDGRRWRWAFAQEVRRFYRFVPALAARVTRPCTFQNHSLHVGERIVLDVPAVDFDPRRWTEPKQFRPERFLDDEPNAYDLVPHGGGELSGHRCPGEGVSMTLLDHTLEALARTPYTVEAGPTDWTRIPALPPRGLLLCAAHAPGPPTAPSSEP